MFKDANRLALVLRWSGFAFLILFWETVGRLELINPRYLPPFSAVIVRMIQLFNQSDFLNSLRVTSIELVLGFLLAIFLGTLLGMAAGADRRLYNILNPVISGVFATPKIVLLPFFMLIFGIDIEEKIYFGAFHGMWIIAINVLAGMKQVDETLVKASYSMGASKVQIASKIYLPSMIPMFIVGLRSGLIFTFLGVILAEMSVSKGGLGRMIIAAGDTGNMPTMLSIVLLIALASILVNSMFVQYQEKAFRWKGELR